MWLFLWNLRRGLILRERLEERKRMVLKDLIMFILYSGGR
jgi:hypothetical protein